MPSGFRLCQFIEGEIFPAIGADFLLRGPVTVDVAVAHSGHRTEVHRYRHADILGDGKEARAFFHTASYLCFLPLRPKLELGMYLVWKKA